jgi:hypothetical protein
MRNFMNPNVRFFYYSEGHLKSAHCLACFWTDEFPGFTLPQNQILSTKFKREALLHSCKGSTDQQSETEVQLSILTR